MTTSLPFDAVIFDLDGTLIDTELLCNETGVAACANLGHPVSMAFFEGLAGIDDTTRMQMIGTETGQPIDHGAFLAEWDRLCTLRFAEGVPLKAGALDLLGRIEGLGLPMAICTSSRRGPASEKVAAAGFGRFFRHVITFDDVKQPKPAPDPYLLAAEKLGIGPDRCLAFEDSDTGARSARAAGLHVVQIPDLHPPKQAHAHIVSATLLDGARQAGLLRD
ncbi:HAD family hydrolase [Flavimaricola marinus]|uniref:Fructose-1-phosphate phosphatase YqaB n=1 Tax=Flavimaricola marinus TaxID=1819565 RepID=A0A238LAZ6_9RHOB|nr:HAD family phosphatase [Flavimaricola marinus]SMY06742.1 Fructose-1-phosphate phosphatase YqaB [Flavimaricola marinus]